MKHKFWIIVITIFVGFYAPDFLAQPHFTCTLANDSLTAPNVYEFDIYMLSNDTTTIELAGVNFGFLYNPQVKDTGRLTVSWVPKSSALTNISQLPKSFSATVGKKDSTDIGIIKIGPRFPPGFENGSIISNKGPGTKIGRLKLTNSVNFSSEKINIEWNFLISGGLYPTTITVYVNQKNTNVTQSGTFESKLINPILK